MRFVLTSQDDLERVIRLITGHEVDDVQVASFCAPTPPSAALLAYADDALPADLADGDGPLNARVVDPDSDLAALGERLVAEAGAAGVATPLVRRLQFDAAGVSPMLFSVSSLDLDLLDESTASLDGLADDVLARGVMTPPFYDVSSLVSALADDAEEMSASDDEVSVEITWDADAFGADESDDEGPLDLETERPDLVALATALVADVEKLAAAVAAASTTYGGDDSIFELAARGAEMPLSSLPSAGPLPKSRKAARAALQSCLADCDGLLSTLATTSER